MSKRDLAGYHKCDSNPALEGPDPTPASTNKATMRLMLMMDWT